MSNKQKTSFWQFIQNHVVQIPIIQRDYAQGRVGKEDLRRTFLRKMRSAIEHKEEFANEQMILDFVYGSEKHRNLNPLDGQQRLTTLWLLHWYIALRSGNRDYETCRILNNFTYETRVSSREFCNALCDIKNFTDFVGSDIVDYIEKRTWFYSAWKQDPTVKAMLKMLKGTKRTTEEIKKEIPEYIDGIEQVFDDTFDFKNAWDMLTGSNCPIVFYYLPLNDFKLTDDLYLKMNARGKQLTSFENFKAELSKYISDAGWLDFDDKEKGIIINLDTTWTNIFWRQHSRGYNIDEIYFAFINRFFLNELFRAKEGSAHLLKVGKSVDTNTAENKNASYRYLFDPENAPSYGDSMIAFSTLDPYRFYNGSIPKDTLQRMSNILNNYWEYIQSGKNIPPCEWETSFHFIPEYLISDKGEVLIKNNQEEEVLRTTSLTQVYRIAFYALCRYFDDGKADEVSLKQWMRVIWNLISNTGKDGRPQIRTTQQMLDAMDIVESIPDTHNVYCSLNKMIRPDTSTDIKRRLIEEIEKANQIINGTERSDRKTWEDVIVEAETYSFFRGSIEFLYHNDKGEVDWRNFDMKFESAKKKFAGKANNIEITEFAKYFTEDKLFSAWNTTWSFNNEDDNLWKYILSDSQYWSQIHCFLLDLPHGVTCKALLDIIDIISSCKCKDLWILNDWDSCEHVLTNYVQRRKYTPFGYVYQIAGNRNAILANIEDDQEIKIEYTENSVGEKCYDISGRKYYRGLFIYLIYKEQIFAYYGNNTICMLKEDGVTQDKFSKDGYYIILPPNATSGFVKRELQLLMDRRAQAKKTESIESA